MLCTGTQRDKMEKCVCVCEGGEGVWPAGVREEDGVCVHALK